MKRFVAVMAFLLVMCAGCYGAEQADSEVYVSEVYVRKEVFNAYIDSVNTKMDRILEELRSLREELKATREELKGDINAVRQELKEEINTLREEIKSLRKDLDSVIRAVAVLAQRVDNLEVRMSDLQNNFEGRMGDLRNDIYLGLVVFGIIFSLPSVQKFLAQRESRKPSVTPENTSLTAEDVKRLIMETLAEMKQHGA